MSERGERQAHQSADADAWNRLATLFETVMSLPRVQRVAYVETACATDVALRTELLTLVSGAEDAPLFFRRLASDVLSPAFEAATADAGPADSDWRSAKPRSETGRRVRHFEVRELLGAGGMGAVYLGRDTLLDRDVALKFLPAEQFTDSSARRRLLREAQAASALHDENVCAMYAIEETDDGGLCLVMHYCSGGTLRERLRNGPLALEDALTVATQLASGLASAHRLNIVHRDLKPANIGFAHRPIASRELAGKSESIDHGAESRLTEQLTAKILDFGVASRVDSDAEESVGAASAAGTLPYMSPEVLRGTSADARADVWALGVILHEMLVGQRPFAGSNHSALLYAILNDPPRPLIRSDASPVPHAVTALVTELLAKNPDERPPDGEAVLRRLEQLSWSGLQSEPRATTRSPRHADTPSTLPVRNPASGARGTVSKRTILIALAAICVTLAATPIRSWWRSIRQQTPPAPLEVARLARPLPTIAVLPFTVRGGADLQYLREGMVDLLTPAFDATGLLHGVDPNSSIAIARSLATTTVDSATARRLASRLGARRYVVGSVVRAGNGFTVIASLYLADGTHVARASEIVADGDALPASAESIVRQLVAAELRAPGDTVAGLAAAMTTSNRALRAYLDGERELRDARPAAAVNHFLQAVANDSLFAVAWYRLARAARWSEVDTLNARAARRAFDLSGSLPLRLQQLVRGYHDLRLGSPLDAERRFRQIVADYPTDVDAWMLLGETLFDHNPYSGRSSTEATDAFRTVMALDMRNREVTVYLMDLAARRKQHGALDTLFAMYFRPNSAGEQPGIRETYLALHARRISATTHAITDPVSAQIALRRTGTDSADLLAVRSFASVLSLTSSPRDLRAEGLLALATLDWADSNITAANERWREMSLLDAEAALEHRALMYASPAVSVNKDSVRSVRRALERPTTASVRAGGLSRDEQHSLRLYLAGLISSRVGDIDAVKRAAEQLAARDRPDRLAKPLGRALRGHLSLAGGEYASAANEFAAGILSLPIALRSQVPGLGQHADRFAYAEALRLAGRGAEAQDWLRSIVDGPGPYSSPYRKAVNSRLGGSQ